MQYLFSTLINSRQFMQLSLLTINQPLLIIANDIRIIFRQFFYIDHQ